MPLNPRLKSSKRSCNFPPLNFSFCVQTWVSICHCMQLFTAQFHPPVTKSELSIHSSSPFPYLFLPISLSHMQYPDFFPPSLRPELPCKFLPSHPKSELSSFFLFQPLVDSEPPPKSRAGAALTTCSYLQGKVRWRSAGRHHSHTRLNSQACKPTISAGP